MDLLVRNISNLTDARYFAALQPTYLALSRVEDPKQWCRLFDLLQPWIEGPAWLVDLPTGAKFEYLKPLLDQAYPISGVIAKAGQLESIQALHLERIFDSLDDEGMEASYDKVILSPSEYAKGPERLGSKAVYVQLESLEQWQLISETTPPEGVALLGSIEEKVGWKSFEELDELIERIT